jgi:hypothetical protein
MIEKIKQAKIEIEKKALKIIKKEFRKDIIKIESAIIE